MFTLFQVATGDSWTSVVRPVAKIHYHMVPFFIAFLCLTQFCFFNVVVAVIVENVIEKSARTVEETQKIAETELQNLLYELCDAFINIDENKDGKLCKEEW